MIVMIVPLAAAVLAIATWMSVSQTGTAQTKAVNQQMQELAEATANRFDADFRDYSTAARTIGAFAQTDFSKNRATLERQIRLIATNKAYGGAWVAFEPNAFDGRDAEFKGKEYPGNGRFAMWWTATSGKLERWPLGDFTPEWYQVPKKANDHRVLEPYLDATSGVLMTSFTTPIQRNGTFIGAAGVDLALDQLQKQVAAVKALDSGYAFLVGRTGIFGAAPDKKLIGKTTLTEFADKKGDDAFAKLAADVRAGKSGRLETKDPWKGGDVVLTYAPVKTGGWSLVTVVPKKEITAAADSLRTKLLIVGLLGILVLGAAVMFIAGRLTKPLGTFVRSLRTVGDVDVHGLREGMEAMAQGDLTVPAHAEAQPVPVNGTDEIAEASHTLNEMIDSARASVEAYERTRHSLGGMIGEVSRTAESVSGVSQQMAATSEETGRAIGEIASAVGEVAAGTTRQVEMVEGARSATERVGESVRSSAAAARETAAAADEARSVAQGGVEAANEASEAMTAVRDSSESVREAISGLAGRSERIGGIVGTITGIAEQTNLLALNAAIEAARAGEQGRGFAVVAEEVRKLAEESQQAAASISTLIDEIQVETHRAVEVVEGSAERTERGAVTVDQARDAFLAIGASVEQISGRIGELASTAEAAAEESSRVQSDVTEIAAVAEEASASTQQVSASTEQTSASAQQMAASAQDLARSAEELERLVQAFKIEATPAA
jgi:methyl-accepting chemotaxis protein